MNQSETNKNLMLSTGSGSPDGPAALTTRGGQDDPAHSEQVETDDQQTVSGGGNENELRDVGILPVRGIVIFPGMVLPLTIGRASALKLIDSELPENKLIGLFTQKDEANERPGPADLYSVGVMAQVLKLIRQADASVVLIVQAQHRIRTETFLQVEPYLRATVSTVQTIRTLDDKALAAAFNNLKEAAARLLELSPEIPDQARVVLANVEQPEAVSDLLAGNLGIEIARKQAILDEPDLMHRIRLGQ